MPQPRMSGVERSVHTPSNVSIRVIDLVFVIRVPISVLVYNIMCVTLDV